MITVYQAAILEVATKLKTARELLASSTSSIVWKPGETKPIHESVEKIDALIESLIPPTR